MRKFMRLMVLFTGFALFCVPLQAQQKTISGVIKDATENVPLASVTITNLRTKKSVQTNATGNYSIEAEPGDFLELTFVGFASQRVRVGNAVAYDIMLEASGAELGEVVVTAMDIKRNSREVGYSVQKIDGDEVARTQRENFVNGLQGRIAGLTITPTSGQAGASSSIVLRGFNSLSLSNQPLFVVDGVILDNSTLDENSSGGSGIGLASDRPNRNNDYTNRIADINPSDIESVTVLKGPEATALYGSQASSGAILITTKRARATGKVSVNYDNSFRVQKVNRYAAINNDFSSGTNGVYSNILNTASGTYFGPAYPRDTRFYDNVANFFQTGISQTHNIGADFGTKNASFRFSGSIFDQEGVIPNNTFNRMNLRISNSTKIGKYIEVSPSLSYIRSKNTKPIRGAGGYLLNLLVWPADNDIRNYLDESGNKNVLFASDPNAELDNPLFSVNRNRGEDETDRYIATLGINLNPFPWLSVAGRFGYDTYKTDGFTFYHPGSSVYSAATRGFLDNYYRRYSGYNHTITATATKKYKDFSGRVMVGTMWQDYETRMFAIAGSRLIDSTRTDSSNTDPVTRIRLAQNRFGNFNRQVIRQFAYFGEAALSYKNVAFLSYTHRFEQASVLPRQNRSYNYPGISLSLIASDIFPVLKSGDILDYWKLRASRATTARLNGPYSNQAVFVDNFASGGGYSYGFTNNNPDLLPETQQTFELGTEMRFLASRINFDITYYNTLNTNQIAEGYRASYGTGFVLNTQNAASTRNTGIEIVMDVTPVRSVDWNWNIRFNFNKMWNKVIDIPASLTEYYLADSWLYNNARGGLMRGGPTTSITGFHYMRNNRGDILINPTTGLPVVEGTFTVIGDRNPDFTLGTINSVRYKNWNLSFLWDLKVGGDIFNATDMYLTLQGKSARTADRKTPRVVEGVLQDGLQNSDNPTPNTIVVTPYYQQAYYTTMPPEEFIERDINWFRLRDITLSYNVGSRLLQRLRGFRTLSVFATANDLILITNYSGSDPALNGNTAGSRGVGAFGFDYGSLPTPVSVNVGLRANF